METICSNYMSGYRGIDMIDIIDIIEIDMLKYVEIC